jgi:hypothetical protein
MRIAPRALLCGSTWRAGGSVADAGFDELRELCTDADNQVPLVMGMAGLLMELTVHARVLESSQLASEYIELLESIGEPTLTVGLLYAAIYAKHEAGEMTTVLRLAQRVIDLADGDPTKGNLLTGSPLAFAMAMRGSARCCLGQRRWKADFDRAIAVANEVDPTTYVSMVMFKYVLGLLFGALRPDSDAMHDTEDALATALRCSEDFALRSAQLARGMTLVTNDSADHASGFDLLAQARSAALADRFLLTTVPIIDLQTAKERARTEDLDSAIKLSRAVIDQQSQTGGALCRGSATTILVESLLRRGRDSDLHDALGEIDKLGALPTDAGFVLHDLPLLRLRALLARARGDEAGYRHSAERYLALAASLEFEGHITVGQAMMS